jgi:O-antigen/teichoic acid export membrane protein
MGPGFDDAILPLYVLAAASIVLVAQQPLGNVLMGGGRHRFVALVSLAEAAANLALSLLLVRRFGLLGVAIGTAVPVLIANLVVLMPTACRVLGVPYLPFLADTWRPALVALAPTAAAIAILRTLLADPSFFDVLAAGAGAALVYAAAFLTIGLPRPVRSRYVTHVRDLARRPTPAPATHP